MEKLLINFNQQGYDSDIYTLTSTLGQIKSIVETYNDLDLGSFEPKEFNSLFFDTETFIFEKSMQDKPAVFSGMKVNKRKFYDDYLEKPMGYHKLLNELETFKKIIERRIESRGLGETVKGYLRFFFIQPNGEFVIKPEELEAIKARHQTFVVTERGKRAFYLASAIADLLQEQELRELLYIKDKNELSSFFSQAIDFTAGIPSVAINYVKFRDR